MARWSRLIDAMSVTATQRAELTIDVRTCTHAVPGPSGTRIGRFVDNLPPLSSVFNGSQQTITSQPSPLRYVILPTCSWSSSSSLTRSSTLHYFFLRAVFLLSVAHDHNKKAFFA